MQQRPLGRSGLAVSRLALGTMTWGRDTDPDDAAAQLKCFLDAGGTLVDTADVYGDGDAESVIGSLLGHLVARDEVLIATKAGPAPGRPRGAATAPAGTCCARWTPRCAGSAPTTSTCGRCTATTRRRRWRRRWPRWTTRSTSGRVRYVGRVQLRRLADRPGRRPGRPPYPGRAPIVATQMEYSLLERGIEREVLPAAAALGLGRAALVAAGPRAC